MATREQLISALDAADAAGDEIAETALHIAGSICVFTNQNLTLEELDSAVGADCSGALPCP